MPENPDKVIELCKEVGSLGEERERNIGGNASLQKEIEDKIRRTCLKILTELLFSKKKPTSE